MFAYHGNGRAGAYPRRRGSVGRGLVPRRRPRGHETAHAHTEPAAATRQARGGGLCRHRRDPLDPVAVKVRAPVFACPAAVDVLRCHAAAPGVPVYAWGVMPTAFSSCSGRHRPAPSCRSSDMSSTWRRVKRGGAASRARSGRPASRPTCFAARSDSRKAWRTSGTTPCDRGSSSAGATAGFQGRACSSSWMPAGDKPAPRRRPSLDHPLPLG